MPIILMAFARRAWGLLAKLSLSQLVIAAFVMLAVFQHIHAKRLTAHDLATSRALGREKDAHTADIARWKAASDAATALNKATIAKVETAQAAITKGGSADYEASLADLRARYDRVRHAAAINQRPANGDRASPVPDSTPGVNGEAVPVPTADDLAGAETELQLNSLIDWNRKQSAVDPNAMK